MLRSKLTKEEDKQLRRALTNFAVHSVSLEMSANNEEERRHAQDFEESVKFLVGLLDKYAL